MKVPFQRILCPTDLSDTGNLAIPVAYRLAGNGARVHLLHVCEPPYLGNPATDQEFKDAALEVIYYSSLLDPTTEVTVDVSPASLGANALGTNDGPGYPRNPVLGDAYAPNLVNEADFGRAVAEFWADGPNSETPPGHWNTLANEISDRLESLRVGGAGPGPLGGGLRYRGAP